MLQKIRPWVAFFRQKIVLQYLFLMFFGMILTAVLLGRFSRPAVINIRASNVDFLSSLIQKEGLASGYSASTLTSIRPFGDYWGIETWLLDERGAIIASTQGNVLPRDWERLVHPEEEMVPTVNPPGPFDRDDIFVLRLVNSPPRFLVFYFSVHNPGFKAVMDYLGALIFWIFFVEILGMVFLLKWKEKTQLPPPPSKLAGEAGFSLISAVLSLVLVGMAMLALQSMLRFSFKGNASNDLRMAVRSLSESIKAQVDCGKTMATVVPAVDCAGSTRKPIKLLDRNGLPITEGLTSVLPVDPLNLNLEGAAKLGNWYVRAYCDTSDGNLVVRYARLAAGTPATIASPATYLPDPLSKRNYDWSNSTTNPLFGTPDRILCKGISATPPPPSGNDPVIVSVPMQGLPLLDPASNCTPSFTKNGKLYLIAIGATPYTLLMPDSFLITGTPRCPENYKAVGGGAQCGIGMSIASGVALLGGAGKPPGYLSVSQPTADGKGWALACCVEGTPTSTALAFAVCVKSQP